MTINGNILTAGEGKVLFNGTVTSKQVHLGIYDSVDNWQEIDADTGIEPPDEDISGSEAPSIITGGA